MNKTPLIFFSIIVLIVIGIAATVLFQGGNGETSDSNVVYTDLNIEFKNNDGGTITTTNFLSDPSVVSDDQNPGMYFLGAKIDIQPSTGELPTYVVTYDTQSGSFNIALLVKPFAQSRSKAESYLKNLLNVDEKSLCELEYLVTIPGYVDMAASGQDYRFSFCPDAVQL